MTVVVSFLLWLDALPARYWACVYLTSGFTLLSAWAAAFGPEWLRRWNRPVVFAALLAAALLAFRWPLVFDNRQGPNPDESQMIAGAIVLKTDPLFWQSVDGTTHGPLVELPLAALGALGVRLDYTNARLISVALIWLMLVSTWRTLGVLFGDGLGRVLVLPLAIFEITTTFWDFNAYSSEHVPIAMLAVATWIMVAETMGGHSPRPVRLGLAGLVLGAVPFAKLQSVPIGLWLGAAGLVLIVSERAATWPERLRRCAWLVGGALTVPLAIFAILLASGIFPDFWISYIQANLNYAGEIPLGLRDAWSSLFVLARADTFRQYAFNTLLALAGAMAILPWFGWRRTVRFTVFVVGGLLAAAVAVMAPHRTFTHYLQFLLAPLALMFGALVGAIWTACDERARGQRQPRLRWLGQTLVVVFVVVAGWQMFSNYRWEEPVNVGAFSATEGKLVRTPLAGIILTLTKKDDYVGMWGWEPRYLVEANRRHATREAHSALELFPSPARSYFRARYLSDFKRHRPPLFVDVVGPGAFYFDVRNRDAHETFPELADEIAAHYQLVVESGSNRVYLRNDRIASRAMEEKR